MFPGDLQKLKHPFLKQYYLSGNESKTEWAKRLASLHISVPVRWLKLPCPFITKAKFQSFFEAINGTSWQIYAGARRSGGLSGRSSTLYLSKTNKKAFLWQNVPKTPFFPPFQILKNKVGQFLLNRQKQTPNQSCASEASYQNCPYPQVIAKPARHASALYKLAQLPQRIIYSSLFWF